MSITKTSKVVLLGESGVGKTSIISRFINDTFDSNSITSLGASFISKIMSVDGKQIKFDIWDTAGQEKYRSLARIFYKDANVVVFVYDITKKDSFEEINNYWYEQIKLNGTGNQILAIAGNKSDLYEKEQVTEDEARAYANKIKAIYQATSALNNNGIDKLFNNLSKKILNPSYDYLEEDNKLKEEFQKEKEGIKLNNTKKLENKNCNC